MVARAPPDGSAGLATGAFTGWARAIGGPRGRRPPRERAPMEYVSEPEERTEEPVDVSDMEFDDAVAALKKKFEK